MKAVAAVLPFRVNQYVLDQLIDWSNIPADPIFQLTFPQRGMLREADFKLMRELIAKGAPQPEIKTAAENIQRSLNPHPSGQINLNVPLDAQGKRLPGMQHKYRETVLFFPMAGRPATAIASTASAGRSSWACRTSSSRPAKPSNWSST